MLKWDCNYVIKVYDKNRDVYERYECYTTEQVKAHIKHKYGCSVYKVVNDKLELMAHIKPYEEDK